LVRCEVCGREIRGPPYRRIIEGAKMTVCEQCSRFGSEEWTYRPVASPPRPPRRDEVESAESLTPVEGYGRRIREAREKLGLDPEKLGRAIGEKTSTLKRFEREELVPDQAVAQKIRRILKVDILTRESIKDTTASPPAKGNPTIGDLMKLKEKKEPDATH